MNFIVAIMVNMIGIRTLTITSRQKTKSWYKPSLILKILLPDGQHTITYISNAAQHLRSQTISIFVFDLKFPTTILIIA